MSANHVILLGDSIFDNATYVPHEPPVIEQFQALLKENWKATLLAIDGHVINDVFSQMEKLPESATHLIASCGGNDAIGLIAFLQEKATSVEEVLQRFAEIREKFQRAYREMLVALLRFQKNLAVCTIYDGVPNLGVAEYTALAMLNDIILREAFAVKVPVIDLRFVCNEASDYSSLSPIEPSAKGGEKIAKTMVQLLENHNFSLSQSVIYS